MGVVHATGGQGRGANAHGARRQSGPIAKDGILVQRDVDSVADLLHLGAGQAVRAQVPQDQVVVRAACRGKGCELLSRGSKVLSQRLTGGKDVALLHEGSCQGLAVALDGLDVRLEGRGGNLLELSGHSSNLVLVRAALQHGEHLLTTE